MGRVPGWVFARHFLETSQKLKGTGLYNILIDTRRLDTVSDYRGYQFLARRCLHLLTQTAPARKLAVISPAMDDRVQGGVLAELYPAKTMRTFPAIDEALAWLSPGDLD
ncbi:hypothetical protein [Asticcacaulis sp. 201]|uniref:hypothetical protein n=1 Tax=Asticcacaulis sp. 201 TaxID=3028787 RepID=UPI0029162DCC|nr:hypothetical protein [Asticcacaulis sp. 201]MDV6330866.1 hypothetical protein [Asticcacaulis sp. 201]